MEQELYFTAKGLTIGYHGVPLIRDITFSLRRGEILSLIGPNGAGKTTLLRSIIRQLAPLGGVVTLDGRDMAALSGKELSTRMAVVLTERVKTELMTCEDVVATGRYPYTGKFGLLGEKDWDAVRESMELVHITELAKRDFSQISGSCWPGRCVSSRSCSSWTSRRPFWICVTSWSSSLSFSRCPEADT